MNKLKRVSKLKLGNEESIFPHQEPAKKIFEVQEHTPKPSLDLREGDEAGRSQTDLRI